MFSCNTYLVPEITILTNNKELRNAAFVDPYKTPTFWVVNNLKKCPNTF